MSNLKQIGLGIMQYTQDYDETYPRGADNGFANAWPQAIQPYAKSVDIFRCPSSSPSSVVAPSDWRGVYIDYAANGHIQAVQSEGWQNRLVGPIGMVQDWMVSSWKMNPVNSISMIDQPAATIMVAEKNSDVIEKLPIMAWQTPMFAFSGGGDGNIFGDSFYASTPGLIPDGTRADAPFPKGKEGAVTAKHNGMANFLFCDGHVKAMKPIATNPKGNFDPSNLWYGWKR